MLFISFEVSPTFQATILFIPHMQDCNVASEYLHQDIFKLLFDMEKQNGLLSFSQYNPWFEVYAIIFLVGWSDLHANPWTSIQHFWY